MMFSYKIRESLSWPLVSAHLCTLAVAVGSNSTWRVPRDAFRFGGLQYGLALTVAMLAVAPPVALLQLALGQLSQQDAVGVWRAVPFFRGVGYLRVLVSFLGSVLSGVYQALTVCYLLYAIGNPIPFRECVVTEIAEEVYNETLRNATKCLNETFMAPVSSKPEYYLAVGLIVAVLWIVLPFVFYNPVKLMKRMLYVLGPLVVTLGILILSSIGDSANLSSFATRGDWTSFLRPGVWHGALSQALLSSQTAGGYLIVAGDTVYSNTDVQWTTLVFVGANILSSWAGLIFWFAVSGPERDTSVVAVLAQAYQVGEDAGVAWTLSILLLLLLSGLISVFVFSYPVFDRFRRTGSVKWRALAMAGSAAGGALSLAALAGGLQALEMLDAVAVPLIVSVATVLEILAFIFIYGWKVLVEDVEFLTGGTLPKYWVLGWCAAPGIITPFALWWATDAFLGVEWDEPPWAAVTVAVVGGVACVVLVASAALAVTSQVQYDCVGKLKSSFQPSRHWGPRDPITHYYWLARREEMDRGNLLQTRYQRRALGQLSGRPSFLTLDNASDPVDTTSPDKKRSNSDDMLYTMYRKQILKLQQHIAQSRQRAKSLDWTGVGEKALELKTLDICSLVSESRENNNNLISKQNYNFVK